MSGWYYARTVNGVQESVGPYDEQALVDLARQSVVLPNTLLYHATHAPNWIRADTMGEFRSAWAQVQNVAPAPILPPAATQIQQPIPVQPVPVAKAVMVAKPVSPQTSTHTVVHHHHHSDEGGLVAAGVLLNFFFPGLGQLVQGRVLAAILWFIAFWAAVVSIVIGIGILLAPLVWILSMVDAAMHRGSRY